MSAGELLSPGLILPDVQAETREEIITLLADAMEREGCLCDRETFLRDVWSRENTENTAVGDGVACPHARSAGVQTPAVALARLAKPMDWCGQKTDLVLMIAVPAQGGEARHMTILMKVFGYLAQDSVRTALRAAVNAEEIKACLPDV